MKDLHSKVPLTLWRVQFAIQIDRVTLWIHGRGQVQHAGGVMLVEGCKQASVNSGQVIHLCVIKTNGHW